MIENHHDERVNYGAISSSDSSEEDSSEEDSSEDSMDSMNSVPTKDLMNEIASIDKMLGQKQFYKQSKSAAGEMKNSPASTAQTSESPEDKSEDSTDDSSEESTEESAEETLEQPKEAPKTPEIPEDHHEDPKKTQLPPDSSDSESSYSASDAKHARIRR